MCVNQRYIVNPYTKRGLYVKCGHCPACQMEKAIHRTRRIKNTYEDSLECAMLTLTYSRKNTPYIDRSEAYNFSRGRLPLLNVYRDSLHRRKRVGSSYVFRDSSDFRKNVIDSVQFCNHVDFDKLKDLKYETGKIGVCFYPDVQRFVAKLRLNLKRLYNYDKTFKTFICSEYGSKSFRPHFHLLLFYPKGDFETLRSACFTSWSFSDLSKFDRSFEKCFRGASYVASYVNCGSRFPNFLKTYFKPKHSYSKGFGLGNRLFSLRNIVDSFNKGSFTFNTLASDGLCTDVRTSIIPKYVIHRYFPKFKGYSRVDPTSQYDILRGFSQGRFDEVRKLVQPLYYSDLECHQIHTRLVNAMHRCIVDLPEVFSPVADDTFEKYYKMHISIWNLYISNILRMQMESSIPLSEKYDNLDIIKSLVDLGDMDVPIGLCYDDLFRTDPNKFPSNVCRTIKLSQDYGMNEKHRSVTNYVLSSLYEEF